MSLHNGRIRAPNIVIKTRIEMENIYEALCFKANVVIANVLRIDDTKYRIVLGEKELEKMMTEANKIILRENGIEMITNSEHTYKRSVLVINIAQIELNCDDNNLIKTIETKNNIQIEELIRIPRANDMVKLRLTESRHAERILNEGLRLNWTMVQQHNLTQEVPPYHPLICKSCYKINEHPTSKCSYKGKLCSLCSCEGHRYDTCSADAYKCINCNGPHCALLKGCIKIKELAKTHRITNYALPRETYANFSSSEVTQGVSFADRIKGVTPTVNAESFPPLTHAPQPNAGQNPQTATAANKQTTNKGQAGKDPTIIYNYVKEFFEPNTRKFAETLNKMMAANGLATYVFLDELFVDAPAKTPAPQPAPTPTTIAAAETEPMDAQTANSKRPRAQSTTPERPAPKTARPAENTTIDTTIVEINEEPATEKVRIRCDSEVPTTTHELIYMLKKQMAKPYKGTTDLVIKNIANRNIAWHQLEFTITKPRSHSKVRSTSRHSRDHSR